jgi:hypothetical protein
MSFEATAMLVSWVAILLLGLVVSGLVRQVHALSTGRVRVRADELGLRQGTPAPELASLVPGAANTGTVLLFLSEGCAVCDEVLDEAVSLAAAGGLRGIAVRAVFPGAVPEVGHAGDAAGRALRLFGGRAALFERYQVPATPFAVVVDGAGLVARNEPVGSRHALRELLGRLAPGDAPSQPVGTAL